MTSFQWKLIVGEQVLLIIFLILYYFSWNQMIAGRKTKPMATWNVWRCIRMYPRFKFNPIWTRLQNERTKQILTKKRDPFQRSLWSPSFCDRKKLKTCVFCASIVDGSHFEDVFEQSHGKEHRCFYNFINESPVRLGMVEILDQLKSTAKFRDL